MARRWELELASVCLAKQDRRRGYREDFKYARRRESDEREAAKLLQGAGACSAVGRLTALKV